MGKIKDALNKIPFKIKVVSLAAACSYAMLLGINYDYRQNRVITNIDGDIREVMKIDGAISWTELKRSYHFNKYQDTLTKEWSRWVKMEYIDGGPYGDYDGKVDVIKGKATPFENLIHWNRVDHYDTHKERFDMADQELLEEKMRFRNYFDFEFENEKIPELPKGDKW